MEWLDFKNHSLSVNIAVFCASAVAVWIAGTRVTRLADAIATLTGIGHAAIGLVLLAGITSLPEVAVALSSASTGVPVLAVNNLLGGIAMQITLLAVADAILGREALTVIVGSPLILLQVTINILMLVVVAAAIVVGDVPLLRAGAWTWGLAALYGISIWKISNSQGRTRWIVDRTEKQRMRALQDRQEADALSKVGNPRLKPVLAKLAAGALAILVAGFFISRTGDAIAGQTGLGQSFVGAVFIAFSTSLPEASAVLAAIRLHRYEMAISDIFGTGLFNISLVFLVDAVYGGGPVLNEVGPFSIVASLLAALLASIFLIGLIERRDRTIGRMGIDSLAVLVVYLGGLALLYRLR